MPKIDITVDQLKAANASFIVIENADDNGYNITGDPACVAKCLCLIGDVVWPGWQVNEQGRKSYMGYAKECEDGIVLVAGPGFFNVAWPRVRKHLELDGHIIIDLTQKE